MFSITYVSTATGRFTDTELHTLLMLAREHNKAHSITGLLLYEDGCFMQAIEGPREHVTELYKRIQNDNRHHGVITLLQEDMPARSFPDWSMAFRNIEKEGEGHSNFMEEGGDKDFWTNNAPARQLLAAFRNRIR